MTAPRHQPRFRFAAALLSGCLACSVPPGAARAQGAVPIPNEVPGEALKEAPIEPTRVDNLKEFYERLHNCWRPPPASKANPENISVVVSFERSGNIFGQPKITYESEQANDNERLLYRVAVMQTLQRCTPMPFTEGMAAAVAGRTFRILFLTKTPPKPAEKRAWLTTKTLPKIL